MVSLFILLLLITTAAAQQTELTSAKMDELSAEAGALVRDYTDSNRRMTSKIRTRFVILVLQLIPTEMEIHRIENPEYQQKFDNIILLLETKMKVKYNNVKMRISNIITRFLEPTLMPFAMMQVPSQEEIQQALHIIETTPAAPVGGGGQIDNATNLRTRAATRARSTNEQSLPTNQPVQSNIIGQPSQAVSLEYLPTSRTYRHQYGWPQVSQYTQEYGYGYGSSSSPSEQYYWPYQYSSQPIQQQQYSPYYYYQQQPMGQMQVRQSQPVYYYQDQYGRIYSSNRQYLMTNYRY